MKRRWLSAGILIPVMILMSGCATKFNASAIVLGNQGQPIIVNFSYDVRNGKNHITGHIRDDLRQVFIKLEGVLAPELVGPDNCMGGVMSWVPEDPNHPITTPLLDPITMMPMMSTFTLQLTACDMNKDSNPSLGDVMHILLITSAPPGSPEEGYFQIEAPVIKGNFTCQDPDPCQPV